MIYYLRSIQLFKKANIKVQSSLPFVLRVLCLGLYQLANQMWAMPFYFHWYKHNLYWDARLAAVGPSLDPDTNTLVTLVRLSICKSSVNCFLRVLTFMTAPLLSFCLLGLNKVRKHFRKAPHHVHPSRPHSKSGFHHSFVCWKKEESPETQKILSDCSLPIVKPVLLVLLWLPVMTKFNFHQALPLVINIFIYAYCSRELLCFVVLSCLDESLSSSVFNIDKLTQKVP